MINVGKVISLNDFAGGLNTKAGPLNLAENETPSCLNVHSNVFKTVKRRDGYTELNGSAVELNGNGLYDFGISSTSHKLIGTFGTKIYKMDALDGAFDNITGVGVTDSISHFENFIDASNVAHLIICNEAKDTPQTWNGSDATTSAISGMPAVSVPVVYKFYMLAIDGTSKIQYSNLGDYTTWTTATDNFTEATADGEGFIGWGILKGVLYAFKQHSIFRITYTGSAPLWTRRQVTSIGTVSSRSICNVTIPGVGEVLMFLGPDARVYAFDGSDAIPISTKIEENNGIAPVSLGTVNKNTSVLANAWAVNLESNYWYVLNLNNTATNTNNNSQLIYDYSAQSWWGFDNMPFLSGALIKNNSGQRQLFGAGYDGKAYTIYSGNSDNVSNINSYYYTRKIDSKLYPSMKKPKEVWVTVKTLGSYTLTFQFRADWKTSWQSTDNITLNSGEYLLGQTFVLGTATLGGNEALTKVFDLPNINNLVQFNLSNNTTNPAWSMYRIDIPLEYLGVAKT